MSLGAQKFVSDGFTGLPEGVDSRRAPSALSTGQAAWLINTTTRDGYLRPRPGWKKVPLTFKGNFNVDASMVQANFESGGFFNGASEYIGENGDGHLFVVVEGHHFVIRWPGPTVDEITIPNIAGRDCPTGLRRWFAQAERSLIIQNGIDAALIYNGSRLRRAVASLREVPTGTVMEYALGRLWVALPGGNAFVAGDLVFSDGTEEAALKFTENEVINEGGAFGVPSALGQITALRSVATPDTTLGQGPLQVFTRRAAFSLNPPFDRTQWKNWPAPIQTVSLLTYGALAQASAVNVNGDIWYRAEDGIRSFQLGRRDWGSWVNTPMSSEINRLLDYDSRNMLEYSSGVVFDNRLLMTSAPRRSVPAQSSSRGVVHDRLAVLNFDPSSGVLNRTSPVWEGEWSGLPILQILKAGIQGEEHCFLFVLNEITNQNELWELSRNHPFDSDTTRIAWSVESRALGFPDKGWQLKELVGAELWLDELRGTLDIDVDWKSDQHNDWQNWHNWTETGPACVAVPSCTPVCFGAGQYRSRKRLPRPLDACDATNQKPFSRAYEFQARLNFTGVGRLKRLRLRAHELDETEIGDCP